MCAAFAPPAWISRAPVPRDAAQQVDVIQPGIVRHDGTKACATERHEAVKSVVRPIARSIETEGSRRRAAAVTRDVEYRWVGWPLHAGLIEIQPGIVSHGHRWGRAERSGIAHRKHARIDARRPGIGVRAR